MIKNVGIGITPRIAESSTPQPELTAVTPEIQSSPQVKAGNTSIAAETQMSTMALQLQLQNQLLSNSPAPTRVMQNEPALVSQNTQEVSLRSELAANTNQYSSKANPTWTKFPDRNEAGNWAALGQNLSTGSGDDRVDIQMGTDGRVHVNVNGKEAWSGTTKQFQSLTIDTGDGNDVVNNTVNGGTILTGQGNDEVKNKSDYSLIDTGDGEDKVVSEGYRNSISTGSGHDEVLNNGNRNSVNSGSGNDLVSSRGDDNSIVTGDGGDYVSTEGDFNQVNSGSGDDILSVVGDSNKIKTEDGNDDVYVDHNFDKSEPNKELFSSGNEIDTGAGHDQVRNYATGGTIKTGEGDDYVTNHGASTYVNTGDGDDYVVNSGKGAFIHTEDGNDLIEIEGGSGTQVETGEGSDVVKVSYNKDPETPGYWDRTVEPIYVNTGDGGDKIINTDGSKVKVDDPY